MSPPLTLTETERRQLIPAHIALPRELAQAEALALAAAEAWALARRPDVLEPRVLQTLHRKIYAPVWRGAGRFSSERERSSGADRFAIPHDLAQLGARTRDWLTRQALPPDAIALRFHHRLTRIRPFERGNRRLARLAADVLALRLGQQRFGWGRLSHPEAAAARDAYHAALAAADQRDWAPLLVFARG